MIKIVKLHLIIISCISFFYCCAEIKAVNIVTGGELSSETGKIKNQDDIIPFDLYGHMIIVKAKINDDPSGYNFVLDTGAMSVINEAKLSNITFNDKVEVNGIDSTGAVKKIKIASLKTIIIGNTEIKNCGSILYSFADMERQIGFPLYGIIGSNILRFFKVTIDYKNKVIILSHNINQKSYAEYIVSFYQDMKQGFAPKIKCTIDDKVISEAVIDTGYDGFMMLPKHDMEILNPDKKRALLISVGEVKMGGFSITTNESYLMRLNSLTINNLTVQRIPGLFTETGGNIYIGKTFLSQFLLTINYPKNELYLIPNDIHNFKTSIFTIGLKLKKNEEGKTIVCGLWKNSPAYNNSLNPGDEILEINNIKTKDLLIPDISRILNENDSISNINLSVIDNKSGITNRISVSKEYFLN